jgi:hypothetical protein
MKAKRDHFAKAGAVALAITFLASNATAARYCASSQEMSALRVAALRQQLMVAALACHQANSFNRFVTLHQEEFQLSDRRLMEFFVKQARGADSYNAYKTQQANDASLKSLNDPNFCGSAFAAFDAAFSRNLSLNELASQESPLIRTGYESCTEGAFDASDALVGMPSLPARHEGLRDGEAASFAAGPAPSDASR